MDDWLKLKSEFQRHVRFKPVNGRFKSNKRSSKESDKECDNESDKGRNNERNNKSNNERNNESNNETLKSSDRSNRPDEAKKCREGSEKCDQRCDEPAKFQEGSKEFAGASHEVSKECGEAKCEGSKEPGEKCKDSEECGESSNDRSERCENDARTNRTNDATNHLKEDHKSAKDPKSAKVLSGEKKRGDLLTKSDYYLLMLLIDSVKQSNAFCAI